MPPRKICRALLKLGSVNVCTACGPSPDARMEDVVSGVAKLDLVACALQETRWIGTGARVVESSIIRDGRPVTYHFYWTGHGHNKQDGVGILVRAGPDTHVESVEHVSERNMAITLVHKGCKLFLVSTYSPCNEGTRSTERHKDNHYRELRKLVASAPRKARVCVLGDFNATSTAASTFTRFGPKTCLVTAHGPNDNDNGERLLSFARTNKLCILNSFFQHSKRCHMQTWHSNTGTEGGRKCLDYALTDPLLRSWATNCRVRNSFQLTPPTDHRMLVSSFLTPVRKIDRFRRRTSRNSSNKVDPLQMRDVRALRDHKLEYCNAVEQEFNEPLDGPDLDADCAELVRRLKSAAVSTLPERVEAKQKVPWSHDPELLRLRAERDKLQRSSAKHKEVTKQLTARDRYLCQEFYRREAEDINHLMVTRQIEKGFRKAREQQTTLKRAPVASCDPETLREYFTAAFNTSPPLNTPPDLSDTPELAASFISTLKEKSAQHPISSASPSLKEVKDTLSSLKNGKSATDIPPELLKYAAESPKLLRDLHKVLTDIWDNPSTLPSSWGESRLCTLYKNKGKRSDPSKYRPLSIGSALCKLAVSLVLRRMDAWYNAQLTEQQQGFRKSRGCQDAIYTLKRIQQISSKMKKEVYVAFIDLTAAFDTVVRNWLFRSIFSRLHDSQSTKCFEILEQLYSKTSARISSDKSGTSFATKAGVRQGGPESPPLFCLFMDWIMRRFKEECAKRGIHGLKLAYLIPNTASDARNRAEQKMKEGTGYHLWVGFADDVTMFFNTLEELQVGLQILADLLEEYGLKLSLEKTETMIFNYCGDEYPETVVTIAGKEIRNSESFKLLGSKLRYDKPQTGDIEVNARIEAGRCKFAQLQNLLTNRHIAMKYRMRFFDAHVRSRMTYACQTWTLKKAQRDKLDAAQMKLLRRMVVRGNCYKSQYSESSETTEEPDYSLLYTNERIYEITGAGELSDYIGKQQAKFAAHTVRESNCRETKQLMFNRDAGKKGGRAGDLLHQVLAYYQYADTERDVFFRRARNREM